MKTEHNRMLRLKKIQLQFCPPFGQNVNYQNVNISQLGLGFIGDKGERRMLLIVNISPSEFLFNLLTRAQYLPWYHL